MTPGSPAEHELPESARAWLAAVLPGTRLRHVSWLTGGRDHANHAVTVVDGAGQERAYVLRRWVRPDWRDTDPDFTVEREHAALSLLGRVGARTPRSVAIDPTGVDCGQAALLMTKLAGGPPPSVLSDVDTSVVEEFVGQLADAAEEIHAVPAGGAGIPDYRPYHDLVERHAPADALDPEVWVRAMAMLAERDPPYGRTFIHRDFHPYNVLWYGHRVASIIDWSYASIGHPDQDTGHMRTNLAVSYGFEVAERFRLAVRERTGRPYERYWDARVIVDFADGLDAGEAIGPYLPDLGRTGPHGDPVTRMATLERMLREALA